MMVHIRLRGKRIGQIDDSLLEEYNKIVPCSNITMMIENLVSKEILKRQFRSVEDIETATEYVQNLKYKNIGDYLSAYMRDYIRDQFKICENCSYCDNETCSKQKGKKVNSLETACEKFKLRTVRKREVIDLSTILD